MRDLIKEVALDIANKLDPERARLGGDFQFGFNTVQLFAELVVTELSKRAEAVAYLSRDVENGDCALDSANSPATKYWTESFPVFTFPPIPNDSTALNELIAERTADKETEVKHLLGKLTLADNAITELTAQRDEAMKRLEWVEQKLFVSSWNGVVGDGNSTIWRIAGDWRHTVVMLDKDDFGEAIDAAIAKCNNKEK